MGFGPNLVRVILLGCCHGALISAGGAAPVTGSGLPSYTPLAELKDSPIIFRYLETCDALQVLPSADAIVFVQLGIDDLAISTSHHSFGDLEMRALTSLLEDQHGAKLRGLRKLDLSGCRLGQSGMMQVSQLLKHPLCNLEVLDLSNQVIDYDIMLSIARSVGAMSNLRILRLHSCHLGDLGGQAIVSLLANRTAAQALERVGLRVNYISFEVCQKLNKISERVGVQIDIGGNQGLDELFNAMSHGLGEVLSIVGTIMVGLKMGCDQPLGVTCSMAAYCASLNILYTCSTLFHAFFCLDRETIHVFGVLDYSGIFVLIAGTYSALLGVLFRETWWGPCLLVLLWMAAGIGISSVLVDSGPGGNILRLVLYVTMGWTVIVVSVPLAKKLDHRGVGLLFGGGCLYTGGIYWFTRRQHTWGIPDHTIWHLFSLAGSVSHYLCVYWYVMPQKEAKIDQIGDVDMEIALQYFSVPPVPPL